MKSGSFLEVVENIKQEDASPQRIFQGEGKRARNRNPDPRYLELLAEAAVFVADVYEGRRPVYHLQEAMTTSDFPILFGDILDRQILTNYKDWPTTWRNYIKRSLVPDFRPVRRQMIEGGQSRLGIVGEQQEYPERSFGEDAYSFGVRKHGARMPFSWESFINDDLDKLKEAPQMFGRAASRTEEYNATSLFVASTGPRSPFYSNGNNNLLTGPGSAFGIAALQAAFTLLTEATDVDGEPILVEVAHLVIPPALEIIAENILNATELQVGPDGNNKMTTRNWMKNRVKLHVNPYLSVINTVSGPTAWYLFNDPTSERPAAEMGFLRGHETPEVFIKEPNARRVGGGTVAPEEGDFDTDSIEYKVRHVMGGSLGAPIASVASTGQ